MKPRGQDKIRPSASCCCCVPACWDSRTGRQFKCPLCDELMHAARRRMTDLTLCRRRGHCLSPGKLYVEDTWALEMTSSKSSIQPVALSGNYDASHAPMLVLLVGDYT
eukprot:scaffold257020_cov15-Prasinocladus_malaysianus.AAC.1